MAGTSHAPAIPGRRAKVTQSRVAVSEWVKLRSLRSTIWTLTASVAMILGIGMLVCTIALQDLNSGRGLGGSPAMLSLYGVYLAQLAYGVLGVLLATGEYTTGQVRSTLAAVPRRLPVLWAKLGVFGGVALVTASAAVAVSMLAGQAILSGKTAGGSLADPAVLRATTGAALYLTVAGLLGMALGFVIRSTAGGLSVLFGVLLVLPVLGSEVPGHTIREIDPYLPSQAGMAVWQLQHSATALAPWTGFSLFAGYTALMVAAAAVTLMRRDA
jgi:ABC-2 type transport system permease protein